MKVAKGALCVVGAMALSLLAHAAGESVALQINPSHNGVAAATKLAPPFLERWQVSLPGTVSYPLIAQGMVFVTLFDANGRTAVFALDQADGHVLWSRELAHASYPWSAAAYDDGRVFAQTTDGIMYAFDAVTGNLDWSVVPPSQYLFSSAPTAKDGVVYTGGAGSGGTVFAFDEATGGLLGSAGVANGDDSSPALSDSAVFVNYACDQADALSLSNLSPIWHHNSNCSGGGGKTSVYDSGRLYVRDAYSGNLVLDAATGLEIGNFAAGTLSLPAINGGNLWMLSGGTLRKVDVTTPTTPVTKWNFAGDGNLVTAPIVLSGSGGDWVIAGSSSGRLYALDANTGTVAWSKNVGAAFRATDEQNVSAPLSALAASENLLVVPTGSVLTAFNSVPATGYFPLQPARLLDTRTGGGTVDGQFAGIGRAAGDSSVKLQVAGRAGVPATGVTAVVMNVTATEAAAPGYVTAWEGSEPRPNASTLNFVIGAATPNLAVVPVAADGSVSLYVSMSTHLVADVAGYFTAAAAFTPIVPSRLLDTRPGSQTVDGIGAGSGVLGASSRIDLDVAGRAGVPANFNGSVVLNVTATDPTQAGYLRLWAADRPAPATSNLNFDVAQTIANLVITPVSGGGQVSIFNSAGNTDVIVDALGWFPANTDFIPIDPARVLDSRPGMTTIDGQYAGLGPIGGQGRLDMSILGRGGVPAVGVGAVVLNITATQASANAFVTVWPSSDAQPASSNLNVAPGQTVPNLVISKVGTNGKISLFNSAGTTHLIADVVGWFPSAH